MAFFEAWSHEHLVKFAYEAVKRMEDQQHQIENMYDAWDCGDRHEIRQQVARREEITRERLAREDELEPPMALVLADVLEERHTIDGCNSEMQAAAELRRLHGLLFRGKQ